MKTRDTLPSQSHNAVAGPARLQALAFAAALAAGTALFAPVAFAEPQAGTSKSPPVMTDGADDLSAPPAAAAPKQKTPAASPQKAGAEKAAAPAASSGASNNAAAGAAPSAKDVTLGAAVYSADGKSVGEVRSVKSEASGTIQEIQITTGGLFGSDAKIVVVPAAKITKGGKSVQLVMTSEEIGKLPPMAGKKG